MLMGKYDQNVAIRFFLAIFFSLIISKRGYDKKSLNLSGATLAIFVGFFVTLANYSFFACLLTFFVTSSLLTKCKSERKRKIEENFKEGGQRNWKQVLCNGGIALFISLLYISEVGFSERPINFAKDYTASVLITSLVGSFACCNGDTWSSEIGTVFGSSTPRLITTLRKVPVGTNGGVSFVGLIASAIGGLVIGMALYCTNILLIRTDNYVQDYPSQQPIILLGIFAGLFGSLLDSYLGAIFQFSGFCSLRKKIVVKESPTTKHISGSDILDNDTVNFLSSLITAIITPVVGYYLWQYVERM